jgi:hypothetical protein
VILNLGRFDGHGEAAVSCARSDFARDLLAVTREVA